MTPHANILVPDVRHTTLHIFSFKSSLTPEQVSDSDMLHIVRDMADPTRLPEGWSMHLHPDSGRHFYVSSETQESTWEHPLLRFYLGYVFMERGGEIELEHNADHNPPTDDEIAAMAEYLVRDCSPTLLS